MRGLSQGRDPAGLGFRRGRRRDVDHNDVVSELATTPRHSVHEPVREIYQRDIPLV